METKHPRTVTELVYELAQAGPDDEIYLGDHLCDPACYLLLRGIDTEGAFSDISPNWKFALRDSDLAFLRKHDKGGVIVHEDSNGVVTADWFEDRDELNRRWAELKRKFRREDWCRS